MARAARNAGQAPKGERLVAVFRHLHVINLPHRTDRRRDMERELGRIGLEPGTPDVTWFPAVRPPDRGGFETIGARGCFESHLAVLRLIGEGPHEAGLILEDDADLCAGLGDGLHRLEAEDWDLFFGQYTGEDPAPPRTGSGLIRCRPEDGLGMTHFVGVTRGTAQALVPYLEAMRRRPGGDPRGGPMHVDGAYSWFRREHPSVRTLCPEEPMARQRPSRTDIHQLGLRDRMPLLRTVMPVLRSLKRRLGSLRG